MIDFDMSQKDINKLAINKRMDQINAEIEAEKINAIKRRLDIPFTAPEFNKLMIGHCELIMTKQNNLNEFHVDKIKDFLNQLYYYATQDKRFNGSFDKGILLVGKYGVGKTLILTAFCNLLSTITHRKYNIIHAKQLTTKITADPELIYKEYVRYGLMIDDLGKEPFSVTTYGTQTIPMEDVLSARYDSRSITFATANLKLTDFKYSQSIKERMKEMFNIIELKGKSMRI